MAVIDLERINQLTEAELDALAQRLDARRRAPQAPAQLVNVRGEVISPRAAAGRVQVAPGQTIASTWGNQTWDQSVNVFATPADRDQQWPAPLDGAAAFTLDTATLWLRQAGQWIRFSGDPAPILVTGTVGYLNGWMDALAPNLPVGYQKIGTRVHLSGNMKGGTIATTAFILPLGYRPTGNVTFASNCNGAYANIVGDATGAFRQNTGANLGVALDGLNFYAP
jgi:hypothetical protein